MNRKTFLQSISAAIVGFFGVKALKESPVNTANLVKPGKAKSFQTFYGKAFDVSMPDSDGDVFAPGCFNNLENIKEMRLMDHDPKMIIGRVKGEDLVIAIDRAKKREGLMG